jgi:hypothetical protein
MFSSIHQLLTYLEATSSTRPPATGTSSRVVGPPPAPSSCTHTHGHAWLLLRSASSSMLRQCDAAEEELMMCAYTGVSRCWELCYAAGLPNRLVGHHGFGMHPDHSETRTARIVNICRLQFIPTSH